MSLLPCLSYPLVSSRLDLQAVCGGGGGPGADGAGGGMSQGEPAEDQTGCLQEGTSPHTHTHTRTRTRTHTHKSILGRVI